MNSKKKRNIIISLFLVLVLMAVGFSLMYETLEINSVGRINTKWNVYISKVEVLEKSKNTEIDNSKITSDRLVANINASFALPGDYALFQITIRNDGTVNAIIDSIEDEMISGNDDIKLSYDLEKDTIIKANSEITFTVRMYCPIELTEFHEEEEIRYKIIINAIQTDLEPGEDDPHEDDPIITNKPFKFISGDINTVGSEVVLGEEHFYIMETKSNSDNVTLLTKYNLLVGKDYDKDDNQIMKTHKITDEGYNRQSIDAKGYWCSDVLTREKCFSNASIAFGQYDKNCGHLDCDEDSYWWDYERKTWKSKYASHIIDIYPVVYDPDSEYNTISLYVEKYRDILENENDIEINNASIMSIDQLIGLLNCGESLEDLTISAKCIVGRSWVISTSYWLSSAKDSHSVWGIYQNALSFLGYSEFYSPNVFGVRPTITVSKSLF